MQLKRVVVSRPVPFNATLDKTLIADHAHGYVLELGENCIIATTPKKGKKYIPMANVDFYELATEADLAPKTAPVEVILPKPRAIDDTIRITKSVTAGK